MTSYLASRLTLIILAVIGGFIYLDINEFGSFEASRTGTFLKDSGALHYGGIAWSNLRFYSQQGYRWSQKNVPVYIAKVREISAPYAKIAWDWLCAFGQLLWDNVKSLYGYILEKKPLVHQWINQYAPGLVDVVNSWLRKAWSFISEYSALLWQLLVKYLTLAGQWLMKNVFVGSLSPENLQKYTMEALNTTQKFASQTFSWLNEKVVTVTSAP